VELDVKVASKASPVSQTHEIKEQLQESKDHPQIEITELESKIIESKEKATDQPNEEKSSEDEEERVNGDSKENGKVDERVRYENKKKKIKGTFPCIHAEASQQVKIIDFGNACWVEKHFTEDIQTRQYRSPEAILGAYYSTPCDIWSMACITFELLTGDLLFEPKDGNSYDKNDDHLALMIELLGHFPKNWAQTCHNYSDFFNKKGDLKKIKELKIWPLENVLVDKYDYTSEQAKEIVEFMIPMLEINPNKRATAATCLSSKWFSNLDAELLQFHKEQEQELRQQYENHTPTIVEKSKTESPSLVEHTIDPSS